VGLEGRERERGRVNWSRMMRGALGNLASCSSAVSLLRGAGGRRGVRTWGAAQGGMGLPVERAPPRTDPVPEEYELTWQDGTLNPEPALDEHKYLHKYGMLFQLSAALGSLYVVYRGLASIDWEAQQKWIPRQPAVGSVPEWMMPRSRKEDSLAGYYPKPPGEA